MKDSQQLSSLLSNADSTLELILGTGGRGVKPAAEAFGEYTFLTCTTGPEMTPISLSCIGQEIHYWSFILAFDWTYFMFI